MRICRIILVIIVMFGTGTACWPAGATGPRVEVQQSDRMGDWVSVTVLLVSDEAVEVEFRPDEVWLELADGSKAEVWRWSTFFPEASADLKKGDRIAQVGTEVGGKVLALSFLDLQEGSEATIAVSLAPGVSQEAKLFFELESRSQPKRLRFGGLEPAAVP